MKQIKLAIALFLALIFTAPAWGATIEEGPRAVIESTVNAIVHILVSRKDTHVISAADRTAIRQAVKGHFDYLSMASRSLGRPWLKLDDTQRTHFTNVFRELLERSYGNQLNAYRGQKIVFSKAKLRGDLARVDSNVIDGTRQTPVDYSLHLTKTGWQVYDIRIEGASMVLTFYQNFQSTLQNGGYPALLKSLENKIAKLKAAGNNRH